MCFVWMSHSDYFLVQRERERERERGGDVVRGTSYTQVWGKGDIASLC